MKTYEEIPYHSRLIKELCDYIKELMQYGILHNKTQGTIELDKLEQPLVVLRVLQALKKSFEELGIGLDFTHFMIKDIAYIQIDLDWSDYWSP